MARREVSRHRALVISREWANNPADAATKFYILAKDAAPNNAMLFDEANLLSRAIGVNLAKTDPAIKSIVQFKGDKVTLISARDRLAERHIGEDINPKGVLDTVHTAVAFDRPPELAGCAPVAGFRQHDPEDSQFRSTLEALVRTTTPGHDDYQAQRNLWQTLYHTEPPRPVAEQAQMNLYPDESTATSPVSHASP